MKAQGRVDLDFAESLIADNRTNANNLIAEEELKLMMANSPNAAREQIIRIEGGLPALPGTEVIMPAKKRSQRSPSSRLITEKPAQLRIFTSAHLVHLIRH